MLIYPLFYACHSFKGVAKGSSARSWHRERRSIWERSQARKLLLKPTVKPAVPSAHLSLALLYVRSFISLADATERM